MQAKSKLIARYHLDLLTQKERAAEAARKLFSISELSRLTPAEQQPYGQQRERGRFWSTVTHRPPGQRKLNPAEKTRFLLSVPRLMRYSQVERGQGHVAPSFVWALFASE